MKKRRVVRCVVCAEWGHEPKWHQWRKSWGWGK